MTEWPTGWTLEDVVLDPWQAERRRSVDGEWLDADYQLPLDVDENGGAIA